MKSDIKVLLSDSFDSLEIDIFYMVPVSENEQIKYKKNFIRNFYNDFNEKEYYLTTEDNSWGVNINVVTIKILDKIYSILYSLYSLEEDFLLISHHAPGYFNYVNERILSDPKFRKTTAYYYYVDKMIEVQDISTLYFNFVDTYQDLSKVYIDIDCLPDPIRSAPSLDYSYLEPDSDELARK